MEIDQLDAGIGVLRTLAATDLPAAVLGATHAGATRRLARAAADRPDRDGLAAIVAAWRRGARWGALRPLGRPSDHAGSLAPDPAIVARQADLRALARLCPVRYVVDPAVYALLADPTATR